MNDARFEDLAGRLLDDELSPAEWSELLGLVRDDPDRLEDLRGQLEAAEMLALSEDDLRQSRLFLEATRSRLADDGFVSEVRAAIASDRRRVRAPRWLWVAAAAVVVAVTALSFRSGGKATVARVTGLSGSLQWIGDGGRIDRDLRVGTALGGGTLEAMSSDSWVSLEFNDGSAVTVSGPTMLTLSDDDQKELHLREGSLFAKVARQAKGRPMLIHTRTAEMEVLGTQLNVEAEAASTRLNVNEGRVRVTRLVDGSVAEVPARHQVVASADCSKSLTPTPRAQAVNRWKSRLTASVGRSLPAEGDLPARLLALPIIFNRPKKGPMAVYVAAFNVSEYGSAPVELEPGSTFRIRGRIGPEARDLRFGVTVKKPGGGFGGKFETTVPARELPAGGGPFDLVLDPSVLRPKEPWLSGPPLGSEVEDCYVFTVDIDAGLAVTDVELRPPPPTSTVPAGP